MSFRPPYIRVTQTPQGNAYAAFIIIYPPEPEVAIGLGFEARGASPLQAMAMAVGKWAAHEQAVAIAKLNEAVAKLDAAGGTKLSDMIDINITNGN